MDWSSLKSTSVILIVFLIGLISFSLMLWAALGDSAIMDELAHIPAGYGYARFLDYRLNPEHPPLLKTFAALPLLFLNLKFPTQSPAWTTDTNGQWQTGAEFFYQSGNNANQIIRLARIAPIILTLLLIVLIYLWSKELLGNWWALLPTFLFALSPTVLAHGHYVTTDIAATFGVVVGSYFFIKFLNSLSRRHLLYAGLAFGLAQLMKFSVVLLIPYFFIIISFFFFSTIIRDWSITEPAVRFKRFSLRAWKYLKSTIVIFLIGYVLIVYPVYFLFTFNYPIQKQASDTEFILTSFAGGPTPIDKICQPLRCLADFNIWLAKNNLTRPFAQYLLGVLMVLQRSAGGNTSYFLGQVSAAGSPYYFPVVYFLKEPLPVLLIVFIALILAVWLVIKKIKNYKSKVISYFFNDYLGVNFSEFSMLVFIIFYWLYSVRSPLNIGVRYLLPTVPFIYILSASAWKRWLSENKFERFRLQFRWLWSFLKSAVWLAFKNLFLAVLLIWLFLETIFSAPYFLSYFNELGGGFRNGYRFVTDSNYDWGQDLLRLKAFVNERNNDNNPDNDIPLIAVDYFGGGNPKYYLGEKEVDWQSSKGNPVKQGIRWLAVSINTLEGAVQPLAPGQTRNSEDEYRWLTALRPPLPGMGNVPPPDYRAGTSIFIYKL